MQSTTMLNSVTLAHLEAEIQEIYCADSYPWVIGYSGGKDSTATLQLVWYALSKLPRSQLNKPVFIIASDTLVETPVIVDHIDENLKKMNETAQKLGIPFQAEKVTPRIDETFWVNLIGRGYPAPTNRFRWCTDRMKIRPANRFILDKVAQYGEVVVVLGVRKAESMTRAQVMSLHRIEGHRLRRHSQLPRAYVYAPIEDWSTDDVWTYLLQVPSPWGGNNRELASLYRSANSGECPLVIDDTTPSCGNSRFGCWVCTVVQRDRSMESLIDNGEEWMIPLLEFRELLVETQDPKKKLDFREIKRHDGRILYKGDGTPIPGPYKLDFCKQLLRELLTVQQKIRQVGPDPKIELITKDELNEIRRIWLYERHDTEDAVPRIVREVTGEECIWPEEDSGFLDGVSIAVLEDIADRHNLPSELLRKLLLVELQYQGMKRRSGIFDQIERILDEACQVMLAESDGDFQEAIEGCEG